jgi:hypothetical protein
MVIGMSVDFIHVYLKYNNFKTKSGCLRTQGARVSGSGWHRVVRDPMVIPDTTVDKYFAVHEILVINKLLNPIHSTVSPSKQQFTIFNM